MKKISFFLLGFICHYLLSCHQDGVLPWDDLLAPLDSSRSDEGPSPIQAQVPYLEIPEITSGPNLEYHLKMVSANKRNYSMLYDTKNKLAYWVAYPLSKDYLGKQKRTDDWAYDPAFSVDEQADLHKGYPDNAILALDRGHQIPSGDRTASYAENASTFYYTNMTPQHKALNQQVWADLENKIRTWVTTQNGGADTMYVVTGAMLQTASDKHIDYVLDNAGKKVAKPKYYYKALAMKKGDQYYTAAFRIANAEPKTRDYMQYMLTVAELEKETGFTFFPALRPELKETINRKIWRK